jgi:hypothetical protein
VITPVAWSGFAFKLSVVVFGVRTATAQQTVHPRLSRVVLEANNHNCGTIICRRTENAVITHKKVLAS